MFAFSVILLLTEYSFRVGDLFTSHYSYIFAHFFNSRLEYESCYLDNNTVRQGFGNFEWIIQNINNLKPATNTYNEKNLILLHEINGWQKNQIVYHR